MGSDFPPDMVFEILSRTSMETLGRCRVVSKEWKKKTYRSSFTQLFGERTNTVSGFFVQTMTKNKYRASFVSLSDNNKNNNNPDYSKQMSLNFLPSPVKILASTMQGLLLLSVNHNSMKHEDGYLVSKRTTRQWRQLPNPKTRYFTIANAMVVLRSNPLYYKIVRFSEPKLRCVKYKSKWYNNVRCEIFDSETWAWRQLDNIRLPCGVLLTGTKPGVSASGKVNWLLTNNQIFAFDLGKESFEIITLPSPISEYSNNSIQIVEYEGRLGLICVEKDEECTELWVVDEGGQNAWTQREKISIEAVNREEGLALPVAGLCNTDVALLKGYYKVMFYKFQEDNFSSKAVHLKENVLCQSQFFPFQSDFELVDLARGEKNMLKHQLACTTRRLCFTFFFFFVVTLILYVCKFLRIG